MNFFTTLRHLWLMSFLAAGGPVLTAAGDTPPPPAEVPPPPQTAKEIVPTMKTQAIRRGREWKQSLDTLQRHTPYTVVHAALRAVDIDKDIMNAAAHDSMSEVNAYALERGIMTLPDLDARLAALTYMERYPDEMQQMLLLRELELNGAGTAHTTVTPRKLEDHYMRPYPLLAASLEKAVAFNLTEGLVDPTSLTDITAYCQPTVGKGQRMDIQVTLDETRTFSNVIFMVAFTYGYPDVFGQHLLDFEREIIMKYADIPFGGANKNEWGFPNAYSPATLHNEFWYSPHQALAYAEKTGGRTLIDDLVLMHKGIKGRESERVLAYNYRGEMIRERNGAIEANFYHTVKAAFGPHAIVGPHPTWFPYPEQREFKKNGLDWWIAPRDLAQVDEVVPFAVRTALAKKWNSPVWVSMHYMPDIPPGNFNTDNYELAAWSGALTGGRINNLGYGKSADVMFAGTFLRAQTRIRLLNYIDPKPLDSPVAVVFGHAAAMNKAGPYFNDVGMELADELWLRGIPTDLIPTSEIDNGSLRVDATGSVTYGEQRYAAVVLYHPEYEKPTTADFFNRVDPQRTTFYRIGSWTKGFDGRDFSGDRALPQTMHATSNVERVLQEIPELLAAKNIEPQTPATETMEGFGHVSRFPPAKGHARLLDGTRIEVSAQTDGAGDLMASTINIDGHEVSYDAVGVIGVRLDAAGHLEALAAGGLKRFKSTDLAIELPARIDLALWRNENGSWEGVLQGWDGDIPAPLLQLTSNWARIDLPVPYPDARVDTYPQASVVDGTAGHTDQLIDVEGNSYRTVTIGSQTWMIDNLRTTKFNDGQAVAFLDSSSKDWFYAASSPAFTRPADASTEEIRSRGLYYNWTAASSDKLCPQGWRLPTAEDWEALITYLNAHPDEAGVGLNPIAAGYKFKLGPAYAGVNESGYWWTSSGADRRVVWERAKRKLYITHGRKIAPNYGLSIRCIKK